MFCDVHDCGNVPPPPFSNIQFGLLVSDTGKLLLSSYEQLWVVQYGEIGIKIEEKRIFLVIF